MLLAIDVGNTSTVVGLIDRDAGDADELIDTWRIHTNPARTADEHALAIQEFLAFHGYRFDTAVKGAVISSVVPRMTASLREMVERYLGFDPVVLEPGTRTGMPILYENPKEVGADRIANAVGAYDLYGGPTVIVDFGTATTVDAVSAKGEYLGGAIVPGIEVSLEALFAHAAGLRRVELHEPRSVIARTTAEAIQSGALYGYSDLVDGLCRRFTKVLGEVTVVATGGLAGLFTDLAESIDHHEPWLTLHGLRIVYDRNVRP